MSGICEIGEILEAEDGHDVIRFRRIEGHYDYSNAPCKCPVCGGLGIPWGGWFHCDSKCATTVAQAHSLIEGSNLSASDKMLVRELQYLRGPDHTAACGMAAVKLIADLCASLQAAQAELKRLRKAAVPFVAELQPCVRVDEDKFPLQFTFGQLRALYRALASAGAGEREGREEGK